MENAEGDQKEVSSRGDTSEDETLTVSFRLLDPVDRLYVEYSSKTIHRPVKPWQSFSSRPERPRVLSPVNQESLSRDLQTFRTGTRLRSYEMGQAEMGRDGKVDGRLTLSATGADASIGPGGLGEMD